MLQIHAYLQKACQQSQGVLFSLIHLKILYAMHIKLNQYHNFNKIILDIIPNFIFFNNGMEGQIKINYQQFKSSLQKMEEHTFGNSEMLAIRMSKAQEQSQYYQQKYEEMKSINEAIIASIKLVFSQEIGEQLQTIISHQKSAFSASRRHCNNVDLTNTFCQKMKSYGSKLKTEQSIEQQSQPFVTPQKENFQFAPMQTINSQKYIPSPSWSKNNNKKREFDDSPFKIDSGEISTRRSSTPIKTHIATNIYCQLCQKVFPPNQFITHTEQCKYELDYVDDEKESARNNSVQMTELNYSKMMRNLLKIKEEIETQINMISSIKEEIERVSLKKKLEKDLKKVIKVISQKQEEIQRKKCYSVSNPPTKAARKIKK